MRYEDQIHIEAPIDNVWRLTEDVEGWPSFTPTMTSVERLDTGPLRVGIPVRVTQPRQRPAVWTVTRLDPPTRFVWQRRVLGVTMTAIHHLEAMDGRCRNTLAVELSGFGAGLLHRAAGSRISDAIVAEDQAFKRQAEDTSRNPPSAP